MYGIYVLSNCLPISSKDVSKLKIIQQQNFLSYSFIFFNFLL